MASFSRFKQLDQASMAIFSTPMAISQSIKTPDALKRPTNEKEQKERRESKSNLENHLLQPSFKRKTFIAKRFLEFESLSLKELEKEKHKI